MPLPALDFDILASMSPVAVAICIWQAHPAESLAWSSGRRQAQLQPCSRIPQTHESRFCLHICGQDLYRSLSAAQTQRLVLANALKMCDVNNRSPGADSGRATLSSGQRMSPGRLSGSWKAFDLTAVPFDESDPVTGEVFE